jgi:hypothetical protein
MTEQLPAPLTPAEADLKDFPYTPIYRARLFGSAFHARANDAEWRAGITLWLKAQDQRPAGSLPDDDLELCRLAELGRDVKAWRKLRPGALHGWSKCSDGRLYNQVVAEVVNAQWREKTEQRSRTLKARIANLETRLEKAKDPRVKEEITAQLQKLRQDLLQQPVTGRETASPRSVAPPVTETKGREVKEREGNILSSVPNGTAVEPPAPVSDQDRLWRDGVPYLRGRGIPDAQARSVIGRWLKGNPASAVLSAIGRAQAEQAVEPISFVTACLKPGKQAGSGDGFVPLPPGGG